MVTPSPCHGAHVGLAFALGLFGSGLAVLIVVGLPIGTGHGSSLRGGDAGGAGL